MKRCGSCRCFFPDDMFYSNKSKSDGLSQYCKTCTKKHRNNYHELKGRYTSRIYLESKMSDPVFKKALAERSKIAMRKYRLKNSLKIKARSAVYLAVRCGEIIVPKNCESCGTENILESHHKHGYNPKNWLDIIWVCKKCHALYHSLPK